MHYNDIGPRRYLTAVNRHYDRIPVPDGSPDVALMGQVAAVVRKVTSRKPLPKTSTKAKAKRAKKR